MRTLEIITL